MTTINKRAQARCLKARGDYFRTLHELYTAYREMVHQEFPVGAKVSWLHKRYRQTGVVVSYIADGLWVRNEKTGKESAKSFVDLTILELPGRKGGAE